jgi:glycosyltransferase involved in cell wall biosynthesis
MRIAIDAREVSGRPTGVGRYLSQILAAWNVLPGAAAHEFIVCAPEPVSIPGVEGLRLDVQVASGHGTLWEQRSLPRLVRQAGADVLFAPGYSGPLRCPVPMVVTVHDVSFAAHPEWFSRREGTRRRLLTRLSARRAARVITVSDFSKREIVKYLGVDQSRVEVIYSGATAIARPSERAPLVLYVGSLFNRRHIPELVEGFARLSHARPEVRLEIVGDNRTLPYLDVDAVIAGSGAAAQIRARAYIPDDELAALYGRASAFAFLSEYEGFGMTPLDALAAGNPIVVLDTEVAREIYGPAAVYVDRPDPAAIHAALERVLFDPAERARILDAAPPTLERYSWHECAHRTLQVLLSCASA